MSCKYSRNVVFSFVPMLLLAAPLWANEDIQQPSAIAAEPARTSQSAELGQKPATGQAAPAVASPAKSGMPTPAKRSKTPAASDPAPTAKPEQVAAPASNKSGDDPLRPIPDAMESGPLSIEAASFKGITPGVTTKQEAERAWGSPKGTTTQNGSVVQLYTVQPFNHVELNYAGEKVSSVVIRLDRAFPSDLVAKQLDLATVRPVLVSNDLGEVLGLSYPERGVLFAFAASKEPGKPSMKVTQIILEPISGEPFVLRAETTLESRYDLSRRDLEQALSLESGNARAHWLYSRVLVAMDQHDKAAAAASEAVRLEPDNPRYRITRAQVLAQVGRLSDAMTEAQKAVESSEKRPHVKAQALCLVGDLTASGAKPDYKKAIAFHTQAIQVALPLAGDSHPAIRLAAKQVLVDAHLGAAHDIAWGEWKEKESRVPRWLDRATAVAEDLAKNEGGTREQLFRVQVRSLAAYVGARGGIDPEPAVKAVVGTGDELIAAAHDPIRKAQLQWELGMALYDALQICQLRANHGKALEIGKQAAEYLAKSSEARPSVASAFQLGRLYFRLGTIHALRDKDHKAAAVWFDKAVPLLDRASVDDLAINTGRHGESFVSMGVSYWEAGQRDKAIQLTEKGILWMERAVHDGALDRAALAIPYNNLAAMHRQLGSNEKANRFQEMASRVKQESLK